MKQTDGYKQHTLIHSQPTNSSGGMKIHTGLIANRKSDKQLYRRKENRRVWTHSHTKTLLE